MKILILKPQDICYGIVDVFADRFGEALSRMGITVRYFDLKKQPLTDLAYITQGQYAAAVDFYSGLLSVKGEGGAYFWNTIHAPLFQICVDFPVYILDTMGSGLNQYYTLCMDRHFCHVSKECLPNIKESYFFPMAGTEGKNQIPWKERSHDLVFVGTYTDYRIWLAQLNQYDDGVKRIGYAYFCAMRDHVELDQKQAFALVLDQLQIRLGQQEFYEWMKMVGWIARSAAAYQREQAVRTLLEAGLVLEVFGDSWKNSPLAEYPNLMIKEQVNETEYIAVMENTKISFNLSYCNHAGYSERYAYSMLNGAVCVSDQTEYLCEQFTDQENIVFYNLNKLHELPGKITWLLQHPQKAQEIADAAYQKAKKEHTWVERAERFLGVLKQI